jgi:hypothetical protein
MRKWTVRAARAALVAAAITAAGTGIANADSASGNGGLLGATQIHAPISIPVSVLDVGNQVTGRGALSGSLLSGARVAYKDNDTDGTALTGGSNQGSASMSGPFIICGNALSAAKGVGAAACKGRASIADDNAAQVAPAAAAAPIAAPAAPASQVAPEIPAAPAGAPVSIGAPGAPAAPIAAAADMPAAPIAKAPEAPAAPIAEAPEAPAAPIAVPASDLNAAGKSGAVSGNQAQAQAPVRAPINICGNAGALGGVATAACEGTASVGRGLGHRSEMPAYTAVGLFG